MSSMSRSPSPMTAVSAGPSNVQRGKGRVSLSSGSAVGAHGTQLSLVQIKHS